MAASCLKILLEQAKKNKANYVSRYFTSFWVQPVKRTTVSQTWLKNDNSQNKLLPVSIKVYFTDECSEERLQGIKTKLPNVKKIETVGRRISHRIIQLIDENGENQGATHRAEVLRIMDEKGLKLVLLTENTDPPVYRLISGKQLHEERLRLKEQQKLKPPNSPVQQKELTFSTTIEKHDFDTKVKQIQQWIDKKHHVKITLQEKNTADGPEKMLALFDQILNTMPGKATYLSKPVVKKEGKSKCILRHMSDKEIQEYKCTQKKEVQKENGKDSTELETLKQ